MIAVEYLPSRRVPPHTPERDYRNVIQANSVILYFPIFTVAWKPLLGDGAPVWNLKIEDSSVT